MLAPGRTFGMILMLLALVAFAPSARAQSPSDSIGVTVPRLSLRRLDASLQTYRVDYDRAQPWRAAFAASYKLGFNLSAFGSVRSWSERKPEYQYGLAFTFLHGGRWFGGLR